MKICWSKCSQSVLKKNKFSRFPIGLGKLFSTCIRKLYGYTTYSRAVKNMVESFYSGDLNRISDLSGLPPKGVNQYLYRIMTSEVI